MFHHDCELTVILPTGDMGLDFVYALQYRICLNRLHGCFVILHQGTSQVSLEIPLCASMSCYVSDTVTLFHGNTDLVFGQSGAAMHNRRLSLEIVVVLLRRFDSYHMLVSPVTVAGVSFVATFVFVFAAMPY